MAVWQRRLRPALPFLLFALLAMVLMVPALRGAPMTHDSFWIDRNWLEQFAAVLRSGTLYPRWLPQSYGGLGSPAFYFYAPLSFYLAAAFALAGLATYPALLAAFATAWAASGATMYLWLKPRARAPIVGALLYMVLPYHVMDFYARGALAEFTAFALLPLVGIGIERAVEHRRPLPLALSYAALVMTHLPTSVIVGVLLIAPLGVWRARRDWGVLGTLAAAVAGGLGIAAVYLLPALTLQRYSSIGSLWSVTFLQPVSWSLYHPALWTSTSYVLLFAGLAGAIALAVALIGRTGGSFWTVWTVAVCAIVTGLVPGFWSLPALKAVQFPWRALSLAEFGLATVVASSRGSPVRATVLLLPLLAFSSLMANPANPMNGEPMRPLPIPGMQDVVEYLPPGGVGPERTPRDDVLREAVVRARITSGSRFRFPALRARCGEGNAGPLLPDKANPLLAHPPAGCHAVIAPLPIERVGAAVSLATIAVFALISFGRRRPHARARHALITRSSAPLPT